MVAGTGIVTHIATSLVGSAAYLHSGQLRDRLTRRTALILGISAVVGAPIGFLFNSLVSGHVFGILLAIFVCGVAVLVLYRERTSGQLEQAQHPRHRVPLLAALGFGVAAVSSLFGVGGPMLAVPLLVLLGIPVLPALAAAQVQSVIIASVGSIGYLLGGSICWPLAVLVGVPELAGVMMGWKIARAVPTRVLKYALVAFLLLLAPYLALRN